MQLKQFDQLKLKNLQLRTYIGIYDWELKRLQTLRLTIAFYLKPLTKPISLQQSIDYDQLCQDLSNYSAQQFDLIENVAHTLAQDLLQRYAHCHGVRLNIGKRVYLVGQPEVSYTHTQFR